MDNFNEVYNQVDYLNEDIKSIAEDVEATVDKVDDSQPLNEAAFGFDINYTKQLNEPNYRDPANSDMSLEEYWAKCWKALDEAYPKGQLDLSSVSDDAKFVVIFDGDKQYYLAYNIDKFEDFDNAKAAIFQGGKEQNLSKYNFYTLPSAILDKAYGVRSTSNRYLSEEFNRDVLLLNRRYYMSESGSIVEAEKEYEKLTGKNISKYGTIAEIHTVKELKDGSLKSEKIDISLDANDLAKASISILKGYARSLFEGIDEIIADNSDYEDRMYVFDELKDLFKQAKYDDVKNGIDDFVAHIIGDELKEYKASVDEDTDEKYFTEEECIIELVRRGLNNILVNIISYIRSDISDSALDAGYCPDCGTELEWVVDHRLDNWVPYGSTSVVESEGGYYECPSCGWRED